MSLLNALQLFFSLKAESLPGVNSRLANTGGRRAKKGVPYAALCLALAFFSGIAFKCEAASFSDNFDAYTNGTSINGQNSWSGSMYVSNITAVSNPNSVFFNTSTKTQLARSISTQATGEMHFYMQVTSHDFLGKAMRFYFHYSGGWANPFSLWSDAGCNVYIKDYTDTTILNEYGGCSNFVEYGLKWDGVNEQYAVELDNGAWSDWRSYGGFVSMDSIELDADVQSGYIDDFSIGDVTPSIVDSIVITDPVDGTRNSTLYGFSADITSASTTQNLEVDFITATSASAISNATTTTQGVWHTRSFIDAPHENATSTFASISFPVQIGVGYYSKAILCEIDWATSRCKDDIALAVSDIVQWDVSQFVSMGDASTSDEFYTANIPGFFATTTPSFAYTGPVNIINAIFTPILTQLQKFLGYFSIDNAARDGALVGGSVALFLAYLGQINDVFGIPIVTIFIAGLTIEIGLIIFKQITRAKKIIA